MLTDMLKLCVLFASLCLSCGSRPAVSVKRLANPVVSAQRETLDPKLFDETIGGRDGEAYRVGPGDTLLVAVYGHPELSLWMRLSPLAQFAGSQPPGRD